MDALRDAYRNAPDKQLDDLALAIAVAGQAHLNQRDKAGAPYILHPLRLMFRLEDLDARIVAALHDVVEDTRLTLDDLRAAGFTDEVLIAVDALTRRPGEAYDDYIERVAWNPLAIRVKLEDLKDNLDLTRDKLSDPMSKKDAEERIGRYQRALARLQPLARLV